MLRRCRGRSPLLAGLSPTDLPQQLWTMGCVSVEEPRPCCPPAMGAQCLLNCDAGWGCSRGKAPALVATFDSDEGCRCRNHRHLPNVKQYSPLATPRWRPSIVLTILHTNRQRVCLAQMHPMHRRRADAAPLAAALLARTANATRWPDHAHPHAHQPRQGA